MPELFNYPAFFNPNQAIRSQMDRPCVLPGTLNAPAVLLNPQNLTLDITSEQQTPGQIRVLSIFAIYVFRRQSNVN
jgi:hypothetical protein